MDLLPVLRTGEAIVAGEAARLPVRCRVFLPAQEHRPDSSDPKVSEAWGLKRISEGYDRMIASWRAQNTFETVEEIDMERQPVGSTNIASIGYDEATETLEVEFLSGAVYQYFNVGSDLYQNFMGAQSKGSFLNTYIRNAYAYSRIG